MKESNMQMLKIYDYYYMNTGKGRVMSVKKSSVVPGVRIEGRMDGQSKRISKTILYGVTMVDTFVKPIEKHQE